MEIFDTSKQKSLSNFNEIFLMYILIEKLQEYSKTYQFNFEENFKEYKRVKGIQS